MLEKITENHEYWRAETVAFYALQSIHGVGFKTLYKIATEKMSFRDLIKTENPKHFEKILRVNLGEFTTESKENWEEFKQNLWTRGLELARDCARDNIRVIFYDQDAYPNQLKITTEPPMWLFIQGNLANLHTPSIAIIGSRKSTDEGLWLTKYIVALMANRNLVSISGLAEGIDQKVHSESMIFNVPTVAVLGTGIDSNYPKGSDVMRSEILSRGGTIVSEYLIGQSYSASNFIRRNRIQAGLAEIVIPVEWKIKSGTAHTVNFAKEYNRFLLMIHLPTPTAKDSDEIKSVRSYINGVVFNIPEESSELLNFITNQEKLPHLQSHSSDSEEQTSLDL